MIYNLVPPKPKPRKSLEECTWAEISQAAALGDAPYWFKVGDAKTIKLQGTIGTVSISRNCTAVIIGFNHGGTSRTIDFQLNFYESASISCALIDGGYLKKLESVVAGSQTMVSYMMNYTGALNTLEATNTGGWQSSYMRYQVLGSTDSSSDVGASSTTATNPRSGTVISTLPADLRSVMKPMTIYTHNKETTGGTTSGGATATVDYLPLLAEYEVTGKTSASNSDERSKLSQYEWYKQFSVVKYKYTDVQTSVLWWLRSPGKTKGTYCAVSGDTTRVMSSNYDLGVSPIFRV